MHKLTVNANLEQGRDDSKLTDFGRKRTGVEV